MQMVIIKDSFRLSAGFYGEEGCGLYPGAAFGPIQEGYIRRSTRLVWRRFETWNTSRDSMEDVAQSPNKSRSVLYNLISIEDDND